MHVIKKNWSPGDTRIYVHFGNFNQTARNHQKTTQKKGEIYGIIRKSKKAACFINPD